MLDKSLVIGDPEIFLPRAIGSLISITYLSNEISAIQDYANKIGINNYKTISSYCSDNNIKHIKVNSLNNYKAINFNNDHNIDLLIYSGGGILRKSLIESTNKGVLEQISSNQNTDESHVESLLKEIPNITTLDAKPFLKGDPISFCFLLKFSTDIFLLV